MIIDYTDLVKNLENAGVDFSLSFVHGVLTAFACKNSTDKRWATVLAPEIDPMNLTQKEALNALSDIGKNLTQSLSAEDFSFALLIDEDTDVQQQALETREWASGFWLGIKEAQLVTVFSDADSHDFLKNLQRIAAMPLPDADDTDSLYDLLELQEYCRMGAIDLFLNCQNKS